MTKIKRKLMAFVAGTSLLLALALALPAGANAADEQLDASFSLKPRSGTFLKNGLRPANWRIDTNVTATGPQILPSKVIDLQFPAGEMTFNPGNLPVCRDSDVGPPPTDLSQPVPNIVARCPGSVVGNGTAKFALAQINSGGTLLDGVIVVFNGGFQGGRPLLKVYAYSYDTNVAVYTEAALQNDGSLIFQVPQLTADSSVTSLNLSIPSRNITLNNWGPGAETVVLPKGQKGNYVKAQCSSGNWPWSAEFTFGTRDTAGDPTGPDTFSSDGGIENCTGVRAKGRVANIKVKLKNKRLKAGKRTKVGVTVRNGGNAVLKKVVVKMRTNNKFVKVPRKVIFKNVKPGAKRSKSKKVVVKAKRRAKGKKVKIVARAGNQKGKLKIKVK